MSNTFDAQTMIEFLEESGFTKQSEDEHAQLFVSQHMEAKVFEKRVIVFWQPAGMKDMHFGGYSKCFIRRFINDWITYFIMYT